MKLYATIDRHDMVLREFRHGKEPQRKADCGFP